MRKLPWQSIKTSAVYKKTTLTGSKFLTPFFIAFHLKSSINKPLLGIIASKKVGCAVKRNRTKRLLRASFSSTMNDINGLIVLIARHNLLNAKYVDLNLWMQKAIKHFKAL